MAKHIGKISMSECGMYLTYHKHENEENIFRKFNAWSVLDFIARKVDKIVYETSLFIYKVNSSFEFDSWGYQELEKKMIIPLEKWEKQVKQSKISRRLELFGLEWYKLLQSAIDSDWFGEIGKKVAERRKITTVFPNKDDVFNAFKLPPSKVKVVVLGQDPYYNGLAHGYAFSSKDPEIIPESLKNIFKEIEDSLGHLLLNPNPNLQRWVDQGVFLYNTVLTVDAGVPNSHKQVGWYQFSEEVIKSINKMKQPIVFMLWGNNAKQFKKFLTNPKHLVLESVHPSPLSARNGFFGCNHFKLANEFLKSNNLTEIDWR